MSSGTHAQARLQGWREQGADRLDPLAFHRIEALQRRIARCGEAARPLLEQRLDALLQAYAERVPVQAEAAAAMGAAAGGTPTDPAEGGLTALLAELQGRDRGPAQAEARAVYPQLPALDDFRRLWTRLRSDSQLRQSLRQAPEDAGPLNNARLVHRALVLMRGLSPGYLQPFLAYVDALAWLEPFADSAAAEREEHPRAAGAGTGKRPRARRK